jgi:hypothetical protein
MDKVPTLEFKGGKSFWFLRKGETIVLEAGAVGALKNGDQLVLNKKMVDKPLTYGGFIPGEDSLTPEL